MWGRKAELARQGFFQNGWRRVELMEATPVAIGGNRAVLGARNGRVVLADLTHSPSCLGHNGLCATNLPLDLLARPPSSLDGARLELAVRPRLLNHGRDPLLPESISQLAVGVRVCEITGDS